MKNRFVYIALTALILTALAATGCEAMLSSLPPPEFTPAAPETPEVTAAPADTAAPEEDAAQVGAAAGCKTVTKRVLYPEGAGEQDAIYALELSMPEFDASVYANADAMNEAAALYEDELFERVANERIPYADRVEGETAPSTTVTFDVSAARGYVSVIFRETSDYAGASETTLYALVLDENGEETSLAAASGIYQPAALVAQQVYNIIDAGDHEGYFGDIATEDIELALDLYNGFSVTDDGYAVYLPAGSVADAQKGIAEFDVAATALYPDFVGDVITVAEYEALMPPLEAISAACAQSFESFMSGEVSLETAEVFMEQLAAQSYEAQNGVYAIPETEYKTLFMSFFGRSFDYSYGASDLTFYRDGVYYAAERPAPPFGVEFMTAAKTGDMLVLSGMLMYGKPGASDSGELSPVTVTLARSEVSPAGYIIAGLTVM